MPPTLRRSRTHSSEVLFVCSFECTVVSSYHYTDERSDGSSNEWVLSCLRMRLQCRLERCRLTACGTQEMDIGSTRSQLAR